MSRGSLRADRAVPRGVTVARKDLTRAFLESQRVLIGEQAFVELDARERPKTRGDCKGSERPCPFVSCRQHLALDISEDGSIKQNFPHLEIDEMIDTCALDVADRGGMILKDVAQRINVTRERLRQIEHRALITLGRRRIER